MSADYSGGRVADLTGKQPVRGVGMDMGLLYTRCGHKAPRAGGVFFGQTPMRCAACTAVRLAKRAK